METYVFYSTVWISQQSQMNKIHSCTTTEQFVMMLFQEDFHGRKKKGALQPVGRQQKGSL